MELFQPPNLFFLEQSFFFHSFCFIFPGTLVICMLTSFFALLKYHFLIDFFSLFFPMHYGWILQMYSLKWTDRLFYLNFLLIIFNFLFNNVTLLVFIILAFFPNAFFLSFIVLYGAITGIILGYFLLISTGFNIYDDDDFLIWLTMCYVVYRYCYIFLYTYTLNFPDFVPFYFLCNILKSSCLYFFPLYTS